MKKLLFFPAAALLLFTACSLKQRDEVISLPKEDSSTFAVPWAVIVEPYIAFTVEAGGSEISGSGRMGRVMQVQGRKILTGKGKQTIWYYFEQGWLQEKSLRIYDNELKARAAAEKLSAGSL